MSDEADEMSPAEHLRDLAERIRHLAAVLGVDCHDSDRLQEIARQFEVTELRARSAEGMSRRHPHPEHDQEVVRLRRITAREAGAKEQWVTPEGYTQLPKQMVKELGLAGGKHLWFFKGQERWEVWLESELDDLFGATDEPKPTDPITSQKATVGRIVHYYRNDDKTPTAAVITEVRGDTVTLTLFVPCGEDRVVVSGPCYSEEPKLGCWSWP